MGASQDFRWFRPQKTGRKRIGARPALRIAFSVSEAMALVAVLVAAHRITIPWLLWAVAVVVALADPDRRAAVRVSPRLADDAAPVAERLALALLLVIPFVPIHSRADPIVLGVTLVPALLIARGLAVCAVRAACRRGWLEHRVLIVGSGEVADRLARAMLERPEYGMQLIGTVDDDPAAAVADVPRLGSVSDLEALARRERVSRIVLAFSSIPEAQMVRVLIACEGLSAEIYAVPRFFEVGFDAFAPDQILGIPLALLPCPLRRRSASLLKRGFDLIVSLIALILLSPVLAIVAAAVRFSGPRTSAGRPPVLFRQSRLGLDGRQFTMMKFRTMVPNDDGDHTWSVEGDPRVSKLGAFLRRTGLDEAPQLWNVLRGDMSLVGPRPERPLLADVFAASIPEYEARHRVRAGITGWAQVNGLRGDTSIIDRARFDNYYVATWTLSRDIAILLRTAGLLLRHMVPRRTPRAAVVQPSTPAEIDAPLTETILAPSSLQASAAFGGSSATTIPPVVR